MLISPFVFGEEICETSNPEIIIDLGGDSKPEKIVYMVWEYAGYVFGTS